MVGFLLKTGLAVVAEKAFDKAGGLEGLKSKGDKLIKNVKAHAGEITDAVKSKDTAKGAEELGAIVGEIITVAKDTGTAAVEIGNETVAETKEQINEVKKVFSSNKPPKA